MSFIVGSRAFCDRFLKNIQIFVSGRSVGSSHASKKGADKLDMFRESPAALGAFGEVQIGNLGLFIGQFVRGQEEHLVTNGMADWVL